VALAYTGAPDDPAVTLSVRISSACRRHRGARLAVPRCSCFTRCCSIRRQACSIPKARRFTLANYAKILGRPFYRGHRQHPRIGAAATPSRPCRRADGSLRWRACRCRANRRSWRLPALPLVLRRRQRLCIVLLLGNGGIVTQWLQGLVWTSARSTGARGIVLVYVRTLYPYVLLPTVAAFRRSMCRWRRAAQGLGSSPAAPCARSSCHCAAGDLPAQLLVFIRPWRISACPSSSPRTCRSSPSRPPLFIGETRANPASAGVWACWLIRPPRGAAGAALVLTGAACTNARQTPPALEVGRACRPPPRSIAG